MSENKEDIGQEPITEEVSQETVVEPEVSRHNDVPEVISQQPYDILKDSEVSGVILPASKKSTMTELSETIDNMEVDSLKENFTDKSLSVTGINIENSSLSNDKDIGVKSLEETDEWVNNVNYSDKQITMRHPAVNSKGNLSGQAALAKFSSKLSLGEYTSVPLWHSGFWLTIRPPYDSDIVNLETELAGNEIRLGRDTSTLVYSNYSVVYDRILTDFLLAHVVGNSLDLPNDVNLLELISIQDYYPLLMGLISSMNPKGYTFIKNCINTTVIENNSPLCDFSATGTVNPMNMLRVNKKALTASMLLQMSKRGNKAVSIDEVKEYQLSITRTQSKVIDIPTSNGEVIKVTVKVPTLLEHVENGEAWISNIIDKAEKLFTDADNKERKNKKMNDTLNAVLLGVYNVWVTAITTDEDVISDRETINSLIDMLSSDNTILSSYIEQLNKYIETSALAMIATTVFKCPTCEKVQDGSDSKPFKEFIPLNSVEHFFDLATLRLSKVTSRAV